MVDKDGNRFDRMIYLGAIIPPGLLISLGDGRAVEMAAEMLAKALHWPHTSSCNTSVFVKSSEPCNCGIEKAGTQIIERLIQQAQEKL